MLNGWQPAPRFSGSSFIILALICGIWTDFSTFGGAGQSAWGGGSFSRQPAGFENPVACQTRVRVHEGSWELTRVAQQTCETLLKILNTSKVDDSAREPMRVHEMHAGDAELELSTTVIEVLNMFRVDENAREWLRVQKSWWSNESESLNFYQLSSKFWICSELMRTVKSRWECMKAESWRSNEGWELELSCSLGNNITLLSLFVIVQQSSFFVFAWLCR